MALRTKTIEYAFPSRTTSVASATRYDWSAITLYIPETSSRTFRSVILEIGIRGNETVAASITAWLLGIKLGAAAFSDVTTTLTLTNSGDQQSHVFTRDVTSYFTTNFGAGSSQTCQAGVTITGIATVPAYAKLIITYEYDDSAATTRVKTVRIPLESNTAQLTATLASIGSNQIPALDTFLPEASKVYREVWFESYYNDGGNSTTSFALALALDAEAEVTRGSLQQTLNTAVFGKDIWVRNDMTTNAVHDFKARSNAVASRFSLLSVVLYVTYEYNHSTSTSIINSLVMPFADDCGFVGNTTAADKSRFARMVRIEEPGTITMVQSGCLCFCIHSGTVNLSLLAGAQTARTYALTAGSTQSGPYAVAHRIDSGSGGGAWGTLARGRNTINFDRYSDAVGAGSNFGALLFLNYTSGKHTDGDGAHNHSTCWSLFDMNNAMSTQRDISAPNRLFNIPETSYYITGLSTELIGTVLASGTFGGCFEAELGSGEGAQAGWDTLQSWTYISDAEVGVLWMIAASRDNFNRWTGSPEGLMDIETTRQYRVCNPDAIDVGGRSWLTYHSIATTVSGTISGSGGGTVNLELHDYNGNKILSTSRVGDGAYSFTWLDDVDNVYVTAYESAIYKGMSKTATPGSGFDIALTTGLAQWESYF